MEKMTQKELDTLRSLQAKQKRIQRHETEFFKEVDARKYEILSRWGISASKDIPHAKLEKSPDKGPSQGERTNYPMG